MSSEEYRTSVDKAGIKCCARICEAQETDSKFLFCFPPVTNEKSRKRCLRWVKNAGNTDLLKYRLTDLSANFYLCSSHFLDWVADGDTRRILNRAVPVFTYPPLKNEIINIAFSETTEMEKTAAEPDIKEDKIDGNKCGSDAKEESEILQPHREESTKDHQPEKGCASVQAAIIDSESQDDVINTKTPSNENSDLIVNNANVIDSEVNKNDDDNPQTNHTEPSNLTNDVVAQQTVSNLDANVEKCNPESPKNTNAGKESSSTSISVEAVPKNPIEKSDSVAKTIELVVKKELITDDSVESPSPLEKANEVTQNTDTQGTAAPKEKLLARSPAILRKHKKRSYGDKRETSKRKAKSDACDRLSGKFQEKPDDEEYEPGRKAPRTSLGVKGKTAKLRSPRAIHGPAESVERTVARSFIVSKDILSKLGSKLGGYQNSPPKTIEKTPVITSVYSNYQSPPEKSRTPVITNIRSLLPQNGGERPISNSLNTSPCSYRPSPHSIEPILRSACTQTTVGSFGRSQNFLHVLNSDRKLCVFSGIPSFDILEKITDTTLKMVMSEAMRSEIQPTMREWIIVTCTKFMLNISLEALAVMFELDEDECSRIVEKTSLFLRRTLSLPDGQKFVWSLPTDVLNGIADFSDSAVNIG